MKIIVAILWPHRDEPYKGCLSLVGLGTLQENPVGGLPPESCPPREKPRTLPRFPKLVESIIVARVQPRTSKGITDLFLPITSNTFSVFVLYRTKLTLAMQVMALFPRRLLVSREGTTTLDAKTSASYYTTKVSFVNGINQTTHTTN